MSAIRGLHYKVRKLFRNEQEGAEFLFNSEFKEIKEFREYGVIIKLPKFSKFSIFYYICKKGWPMKEATLIKSQGDHRNLICYRKAELIYDITCHFAYLAFELGNRTIDQMVQAARSGKQNIIEGNADIETSIEMGIKLINVAKASFKELLADYEDYLRVNGYEQWCNDSDKFVAMRKLGSDGSNQSILDIAKSRPLDTVANMAIILLKQEDYLLHKLLASLSEQFLDEGGFKEKMHRMRVERRAK